MIFRRINPNFRNLKDPTCGTHEYGGRTDQNSIRQRESIRRDRRRATAVPKSSTERNVVGNPKNRSKSLLIYPLKPKNRGRDKERKNRLGLGLSRATTIRRVASSSDRSMKQRGSDHHRRQFQKSRNMQMTRTRDDVPEELDAVGQLLRALAAPLGGEGGQRPVLQVDADRRELDELPLDLQTSHSCPHPPIPKTKRKYDFLFLFQKRRSVETITSDGRSQKESRGAPPAPPRKWVLAEPGGLTDGGNSTDSTWTSLTAAEGGGGGAIVWLAADPARPCDVVDGVSRRS